jgi:hypothetical protein
MCLQVLLFSLKLSELFVALGDNIAVLAYLHAHLFSHVALLGFVKLFLQVSHALVFYIELSLELGFSISTIRHETMAIFKTLGASDRKEAAKIAQEQSLL